MVVKKSKKSKTKQILYYKHLMKYRPDLKNLCKFYLHKIALIYSMIFQHKCPKPPFLKRDFYLFEDYFVYNQLVSFNWHFTYLLHPIEKYLYFQFSYCKYKNYKFSLGASYYYAIPNSIYYEIGLFFTSVSLFIHPDIVVYKLPLNINGINYIIDFDYFKTDYFAILEQVDNLLSFATCNNVKFNQIKLFVDYRYFDLVSKLKHFLKSDERYYDYVDMIMLVENMQKNNQLKYVKIEDKDVQLNFKMIMTYKNENIINCNCCK